MNSIEKLISLLEESQKLSFNNEINRLNELYEILKSPMDYTQDLIIELNSLLADEEKYTQEELNKILKFIRLQPYTKNYLLNSNEKIKQIQNDMVTKIINSKKIYENYNNDKKNIDSLLRKLRNKSMLNKEEIELLLEIMKEKIDYKNQILILREINKRNIEVFNKYNITIINPPDDDTEEIIEEDMEITNVNKDEISALLSKYGIKYSDFSEENKILLSKFGKLEQMKLILNFLEKEGVLDEKLCSYTDIIARTLVYSSIEKLEELKNTNGLDFKEVVRAIPTVLYPSTYSRIRRLSSGGEGPTEHTKSGLLNNVLKNIDLLKENNISVSEIWSRCYSFFRQSYKANRDNIKCLKSYGISLVDENNVLRDVFSTLGNRNPSMIDIYDMALEADAREYAIKNPSSLSSYNMYKFYLIKAARKQGMSDKEIFRGYQIPSREISLNKKYLLMQPSLSKDIKEQFRLYNAADVYIPNKEVYDNLFNIVTPIEISQEVLNDQNIKALEKFSESDDVYNFNGTRISKRKVLRYYSVLKNNNKAMGLSALMYCIVYNSMLDQNELYNIYDLVKKVVSFDVDDEINISPKKYNDINEETNKKITIGGSAND